MLALISALAALACPTIATGTPSQLSFDTAQVAIVRQGTRTTFTVSINPTGNPQEFALVIPLPEVLSEDEIHVLDPEVFSRLDGYTAPRRVVDAGCNPSGGSSGSDGGGDGGSGGGWDTGEVTVEAEYIVGEYEVVILSATESSGLFSWLDSNGYYLAEGVEPRLQEYIDAGMYFLAARVYDGAVGVDGSQLSPLQMSYDHPVFTIPLRLAVLNSPGEQDMVIYAITDADERGMNGRVGVSNYPEFELRTGCLWGESSADFRAFYEEHYTEAWNAVGDAGWTVEYAGNNGDCNPCTGISLTEDDAVSLGFQHDWGINGHHMTRIRMRYTVDQVTEDLMLYGSGIYSARSNSFADDNASNRDCIEFYCDGTANADYEADDSGSGGGSGGGDGGSADGADGTNGADGGGGAEDSGGAGAMKGGGCGCDGTGGLASGGLGLLAALGLLRRRRD
jgi:hypothetical protein